MDEYQEGQTATAKDGRRVIFKGGQWVNYSPLSSVPRAKTTPQDMKALSDASAQAAAEADAQRDYGTLTQAVRTFKTGPVWGNVADALAPNEGGFFDGLGSVVGALPMAVVGADVKQARDRINTAAAANAITASQQMKGAASDRDMALLRSSGVSTTKSIPENLRILGKAQMDSKRSQARALLTNKWIAKYGSLSQASPNGTTFEDAVNDANRDLENQTRHSSLPKAPPVAARKPITNSGWTVREIK